VIKWQAFLRGYNYTIEHRAGKYLVLEDGLSRVVVQNFTTSHDIVKAQATDPILLNLIKILNNENVDDATAKTIYNNNKDNLILENNVLYYLSKEHKRLAIPESLQKEIMHNYHDIPSSGHLSYLKTFSRMQLHVWFPRMFSIVKRYCEDCEVCDKNRTYFKINDTLKPVVSTKPFQVLVLDHCGPFSPTKRDNEYVLTVVDHFTRKRWFLPVKSTKAEDSFQALLDYIFTPFEFPRMLVTDQGSGFTSKIALELAKYIKYDVQFALPDQHNTVGSAEISNKIIEGIVRKYIDQLKQNDWDNFIGLAAYALNKSISVHGYSPDYLIFGREQINPYIQDEENHQPIEQFVQERQEAMNLATKLANDVLVEYRKKIEQKNNESKRKFSKFSVGNWVYLKKPEDAVEHGLSRKLATQSLGPYKIREINEEKGNVTIQIAPGHKMEVKNNLIRLSKNQDILLDPDELKATTLKEILILKSLSEIKRLQEFKQIISKNKKQFKIPEDLVGKRVQIYWKTGPYKGWHPATIVGYTANKAKSLVYYDQRNINADPTTDYYAHDLRSDSREVWKFL
jgi:hypothetical protein